MNKLKWKLYLNSIINAHDSEPLKYPNVTGLSTYCFKYNQTYYDELIICPNIGLPDQKFFNRYFDTYRITALNITFTGACCISPEKQFYKEYARVGTFKLIYYPNNPMIKKTTIELDSVYWFIKSPTIDVCIHYEILPFEPDLMIPTFSTYTDLTEFEKEYYLYEKDPYNEIKILNNINDGTLNEDIGITRFLAKLL